MFPQGVDSVSNSYGYGQLNPYSVSPPYRFANPAPAGGKTLLIISGITAICILIGMALGLGLGIGAAGLISSTDLINVTNTTSS
jgi:hypothetical protein